MKNSKIQLTCKIAIMGALAAIVMMIDIPLPIFPTFYKIDFSEVIVLLSGFALGPIPAIAVEAIKNALHLLQGSQTAGVGELANFVMGISYVLPASIIYKRSKSIKNAIIGLFVGILCLCVVASIFNYFVLLPTYAYAFNMPLDAIVAMGSSINGNINDLFTFITLAVVPFNLLKGGLNALIVFLLYKRVSPILKKEY